MEAGQAQPDIRESSSPSGAAAPPAADAVRESATTQVERLVEGVPGWTPLDQLCTLYQIVRYSAPLGGDVVDLGTWCGRSALTMALAARASGVGRVHAVDPFPEADDWYESDPGMWSFTTQLGDRRFDCYQDQRVWAEPFERDIRPLYERNPSLLALFQGFVAERGFDDTVITHRGDRQTLLESVPSGDRFRVVFLDGDHSYGALCDDIAAFEERLVPGGWLCFDDAFTTYEGVDRAIEDRVIASGRYDVMQQMTRKLFVARRRDTE